MNLIHTRTVDYKAWLWGVPILLLLAVPRSVRAAGAGPGLSLDALIQRAWARNPQIAAARARVRQAEAAEGKLRGFFDPALSAAIKRYGGNLGSAFESGASVDVPFLPGFYLDLAAAEDRYSGADTGTGAGGLYQTVMSARIDIPLLRDRGFRQWHLDVAAARAARRAAEAHLRGVEQAVRHEIEQRYIAMLEAAAYYRIRRAATGRVVRLLVEAKELVRLKVVPQYQLFVAKMEVALARASEREAKEGVVRSVQALLRAVGLEGPREFHPPAGILVRWANAVAMPPRISVADALRRRGDYCEQRALAETVRFQRARTRETLRSDLTLSGETVWKGQNADFPLATGRLASERRDGSLVMLTWSRPLGYRSERAELARQTARLRERAEVARGLEIDIRTALGTAWRDITAAREQLALVTEAVQEAHGNLASEEERFRLGQARSRNVLDAQTDLTNAIRQQSRTAAVLLRAVSNYLYAGGYPEPLESPPPPSNPQKPRRP